MRGEIVKKAKNGLKICSVTKNKPQRKGLVVQIFTYAKFTGEIKIKTQKKRHRNGTMVSIAISTPDLPCISVCALCLPQDIQGRTPLSNFCSFPASCSYITAFINVHEPKFSRIFLQLTLEREASPKSVLSCPGRLSESGTSRGLICQPIVLFWLERTNASC